MKDFGILVARPTRTVGACSARTQRRTVWTSTPRRAAACRVSGRLVSGLMRRVVRWSSGLAAFPYIGEASAVPGSSSHLVHGAGSGHKKPTLKFGDTGARYWD